MTGSARTRSLEIPRCAIAHLRSGPSDHPGMTASPSIINPDRPDLDRTIPGAGNTRGNGERCVEILGLDQIVTAELLARSHERTIRGKGLAVTDAHGGGGSGRLQPVAGLEIAALDDGLGERSIFVGHFLARRRVHFGVLGFVSVDHQQILHLFAPFAWQVLPTSSRTGQSQNDIFRIIYFAGPTALFVKLGNGSSVRFSARILYR